MVLRRLLPGDLDPFLAYRSDPQVARFQSWSAMDRAEALDFLNHMTAVDLFRPGHWTQIAIASEGGLMGDMGVHVSAAKDEAELGITLARAAQGRGYGQEAVALALTLIRGRFPCARLVMWTDRRNAPAQRLIRRAGLVWEAKETTPRNDGPDLVEDRFVLP